MFFLFQAYYEQALQLTRAHRVSAQQQALLIQSIAECAESEAAEFLLGHPDLMSRMANVGDGSNGDDEEVMEALATHMSRNSWLEVLNKLRISTHFNNWIQNLFMFGRIIPCKLPNSLSDDDSTIASIQPTKFSGKKMHSQGTAVLLKCQSILLMSPAHWVVLSQDQWEIFFVFSDAPGTRTHLLVASAF